MDAESEAWDEIADRLTVIYNHMRLAQSDIHMHTKGLAKAQAELSRYEAKAHVFEALLASDVEGTPA